MTTEQKAMGGVICALTVLLVGACGQDEPVRTPAGNLIVEETDTGVSVSSEDGSVLIQGNEHAGRIRLTTEDGQDIDVAYNQEQVAENFPVDVPVYSPGRVVMSQVFAGGNAMLTMATSDSPQQVASFYARELPKRDWAVGGETGMGGMCMLQGKKGQVSLTVSAVVGQGETKIHIARTVEDG